MLNTDLHNPQVRVSRLDTGHLDDFDDSIQKRMTLEDYTKNLKGVNDGGDFSPEFLVCTMIIYIWVPISYRSLVQHIRVYSQAGDRHARGAYRSTRVRVCLEGAPRSHTASRYVEALLVP